MNETAEKRRGSRRANVGGDGEERKDVVPTKEAIDNLLLSILPQVAAKASEGLAKQLTGSIRIRLRDVRREFVFEWQEGVPAVRELAREQYGTETPGPDACVIATDSAHILNVVGGHLNPQIAMLSDKIDVSGQVAPALYFFNLFL